MRLEMIGRLELFKDKPIIVTKIGAAYAVVPGTIVTFSESKLRIRTDELQLEHYGQHVVAEVETL
ncbi:hypothetical protein LSG31_20540 [Fodinisporobacter ferrooxydans]|uniref:Uncharacterized protein n=1 Tax=Fodinisporobacter ferrooxydans TaxID=2901836 RepID=A0ABY4CIH8_9BACL|nr:hypothetical protein LSG31_20540 [Alicyclobacillaceae bacterium MYW30-H2]